MPPINAPHILNEVKFGLRALRETGEEKIIYLANLPLTEEDFEYLQQALGRGTITIRAEGTDVTTWRETSFPGVWWGEYCDGPHKVTLRTIEIAAFPQLARAQPEDIEQGLERLEKH
jgi:hydrogenase-1 operon protein HyaF